MINGECRQNWMKFLPNLLKLSLIKKIKWFYWHPGVNPVAVSSGAISNIIRGERVSGASTITMQVVRLLESEGTNIFK